MATTLTSSIINSLQVGLDAVTGLEYNSYAPEWSQIYETRNSSKNKEEILMRSGLGLAYETKEGAPTPMDSMGDEWVQQFVHATVKLGFRITQDAIEDNQYKDLVSESGKELARAFLRTKEVKGAALFNNATSTSRPYKGGDGVALLSTAHPLANGDTFSNFLSGMQLSESALEQAYLSIRNMVDERGNRVMLKPQQLITSANNHWQAIRLLQSDLRPGTNANDVNAIKTSAFIGKAPLIMTYLIDTDAWFIQTDANKGFIHYNRVAFSTKMEDDNNTSSIMGYGRERYSFGFANPRCVVGSMGS